jgi:N-acetyl sugar amidotransferase
MENENRFKTHKYTGNEIFRCKICLNMSTRPRIEFDNKGCCNACVWSEEKKVIDWEARRKMLDDLIGLHVNNKHGFNCLVPVSGGKDSSYVAYKIKHEVGLNPLTITINPALSFQVNDVNLRNFINSGYNNIAISADPHVMRKIDKFGFKEFGLSMFSWQVLLQTIIPKIAINMGIPFIMYGEDGEVEYGGSSLTKNQPYYTLDYARDIYLSGNYQRLEEIGLTKEQLAIYQFPTKEEIDRGKVLSMHWSFFEPWDSYRNYCHAKQHSKMQEKESAAVGTYNNFSQNDTSLYDLHAYLMYLKFGFGRVTQDAGIDIRRGAMDREQAINLVKLYENTPPSQYYEKYMVYYSMTESEFNTVIDKWANKDLFEKVHGVWTPKKWVD